MRFRSIKPSDELQSFVASYFQWLPFAERQIGDSYYQTEALPIDLGWSIAFIGGDAVFYGKRHKEFSKLDSIAVAGQQTSSLLTKTSQRAEIFGVNFLPASLPLLFSIPAGELTDTITDAAPLAAFGLREIGSRLSEANKFSEKVSILERFLQRRVYQAAALDADFALATSILQLTGGASNVEQVARECGISVRKLERLFHNFVGISPKKYLRINRFRAALLLARRQSGFSQVDWADVAAQHYFYDQSHLINDFQEFGGLSPLPLIRLLDKNAPLSDFSNT